MYDISLLKNVDFIIVGSIEEKESMIKYNKNCFIFPLIERMYLNKELKIHNKKDNIIIGYHGNSLHLNHMKIGLKSALEKLSKEINIKLIYICETNKNWVEGIPNISVQYIKWDLKTIENDIRKFDIGIVPTISEFSFKNSNKTDILGKYHSDINIRFKTNLILVVH